jgi:hypothetical protein
MKKLVYEQVARKASEEEISDKNWSVRIFDNLKNEVVLDCKTKSISYVCAVDGSQEIKSQSLCCGNAFLMHETIEGMDKLTSQLKRNFVKIVMPKLKELGEILGKTTELEKLEKEFEKLEKLCKEVGDE